MESLLRNWEIVLYALFVEGGAGRRVHTEDVALRCFALAQDAFSWVKHREHADKEVVRRDLIRLRMGDFGAVFVQGRAGKTRAGRGHVSTDGWQLTQEGVRWVAGNERRLEEHLSRRAPRTHRQDALRHVQRVRDNQLFCDFLGAPEAFVPPIGQLAALLRCRVDAEDHIWEKRFTVLRNLAELVNDADVLAFAERCEMLRPSLE